MKRSRLSARYPLSLADREVHRLISEQLADLLPDIKDGYSCDQQTVSDIVLKATVEGSAIEGACNTLENAPTGMTVRAALNEALPVTALHEIGCAICAQLVSGLPGRLWNGPLALACDLHDEPFYGNDPILKAYARRGEARQGTTWFYRVATIYVLHRHIPYTLGLVFVLPGDTVQDVLKALLHQVQDLGLHIGSLYLDKGFCVQPVIEFLKDQPYEATIACPIRGRKGGTRALCTGRKSYFAEYTFCAGTPEAYTAPLAVVRTYEQHHGQRRAVWLIYVVIHVSTQDLQAIRARYRSRFGIETGYRCMRQTHALTTSRNPALRFFLLGVAFLILNLWVALRWRWCQRPRRGGRTVDKKAYELQRHRQFIAQVIDEKYKPVSGIQAWAAPLDP